MTRVRGGVYHCSVCDKALPMAKPPKGKIFVEIFCSLDCKFFSDQVKTRSKEIVKAVFRDEGKDV